MDLSLLSPQRLDNVANRPRGASLWRHNGTNLRLKALSRSKASVGRSKLQPPVPDILHRVHQRQLLPALIAVSHVGVEESGFFLGEVVLYSGEEGGPGGAGVGHLPPVGTRCFNSSSQLRTRVKSQRLAR